MLLKLHSFINNTFINCFKTFSYLRKNNLLEKFYLSLILMSFSNNPCWSLFIFLELTTNDFCLPYVYPKTQFLLLKVKDFEVFYPHARGFASLLLVCCPPSLHNQNLELLNHRSPWKCYPTLTSATYYPIRSMTLQRAYI